MPGDSYCFMDTNVLLYSISSEAADKDKADVAEQLLTTLDWCWSAQVAAEFINASTSARRANRLSLSEAENWIDEWMRFPMAVLDASTVRDALQLANRYPI